MFAYQLASLYIVGQEQCYKPREEPTMPIDVSPQRRCLLQVVSRYVSALDRLANTVDEGIAISCDASRRSTWPPCIPLFDHFRVEVEIYVDRAVQRVRLSLSAIAYVWYWAGFRVTLQTRYLRFILPQ